MKTGIILLAATVGTAAIAHTGVEDEDVLARMNGMSAIAQEMKTIGSTAKGEIDFEASRMDAALKTIAREAERIPTLFSAESTDPKSEALPEIWTDFADFQEKAGALQAVSSGLVGEIESVGDLRPAMRRIGKTCRACHADYRASD